MAKYTYACHKCNCNFPNREDATRHYNEKWHQYNLLRILKDLPSISQDAHDDLMKKSAFFQEAKNRAITLSCGACKKNFTSQGSFDTHQRSRKHKQNVIRKAAENARRLTIQKQKEKEKQAAAAPLSIEWKKQVESKQDGEGEDQVEVGQKTLAKLAQMDSAPEGDKYCRTCKATFHSEKDFLKHAATLRHKHVTQIAMLAEKRKAALHKQDQDLATAGGDNDENGMEVEEVDSDEWENESNVEEEEIEEIYDKALPPSVCLFCSKRSGNIADNIGHMGRHHSFIIPHQPAGDMDKLATYLGEKIGEHHQCLECSKSFRTLRACRLHMLDKPHLAIRFEGEYDQFFEVEKILADLVLPPKPADNDIFAFPLPNGTMLTHRDLRRYFQQRLSLQPTALGLKRLQGAGIAAITHLGKTATGISALAVRKEHKRRGRDINTMLRVQKKLSLDVAVKANKLMPHLRPQVMNAG